MTSVDVSVLILSREMNDLSTAVLIAGIVKIKVTSFGAFGSASFSELMLTYAVCCCYFYPIVTKLEFS